MSSLGELGRHAGRHLVGRVGLALLGLVSFPVLARLLSVEQYGRLSLLLKLALLWTVLGKAGLQNAVLRYTAPAAQEGPARKREVLSTLFLLAAALAGGMALLAGALGWAGLLPAVFAGPALLGAALGLVCVRTLQPALSAALRAEGRTVLFNVCELSGKALAVAFSLLALGLVAADLRLYVSALLLAEGSVLLALLVWFARKEALSPRLFDSHLARQALLFGAPLIAYELASVVLDSGDRLLIGRYAGLEPLGLYSAAYSLATYTEEAVLQPVNLALFPAAMALWAREGEPAVARLLARSLDLFFAAACGVLLLVLLTARDLVVLAASQKFAAAAPLLPVLVAGLLIYALHIFFNTPLMLHRRTLTLSLATGACCALNLLLNVLLIPRVGILGSAWATLLSYLALTGALAAASRRSLPFPLPWRGGAAALGSCFAMWAVLRGVHTAGPASELLLRGLGGALGYGCSLLCFHPEIRGLLSSRLRTAPPALKEAL